MDKKDVDLIHKYINKELSEEQTLVFLDRLEKDTEFASRWAEMIQNECLLREFGQS